MTLDAANRLSACSAIVFFRASAVIVACASLLALAGCSLDSSGLRQEDAGVTAIDSGGPLDASLDGSAPVDAFVADGCVRTTEVCNLVDDDCDGIVDNGINLATDPLNCGACASVCGVGMFCVAARCVGNVIDVAAGESFNCAVRRDGAVFCWGDNNLLQLGSTGPPTGTPVRVAGITDAVEVTAGQSFACALHATGTVSCWGQNDDAQLGRGTRTTSESQGAVPSIVGALSISAGFGHVCVVRGMPRELWCWGRNDSGQVGADAGGTAYPNPAAMPARAEMLGARPTRVSAGGDTTCADLSGALSCWGRNMERQLGGVTIGDAFLPVPTILPAGMLRALSVGDQTVCAAVDNSLYCWGRNDHGQVGDGTTTNPVTPVPVDTSIADFDQVDVGYDHTCGRRRAGTVACWGTNAHGELALGAIGGMNQTVPSVVTGVTNATKLALGRQHTCVLRADGVVSCWGDASLGQIGRVGTSSGSPVDVAIPSP